MTRPSRESETPEVGVEYAALTLSALLLSLASWCLVQRHAAEPLFSLGGARASDSEAVLVAWTTCAETLLLLLAGVVAASALVWRGRPRLARRVFVVWASAVGVFVTLDTEVFGAFGRHVAELARFAFLPGAAQVAGSSSHWLGLIALWSILAALGAFALTWLARSAVRWCAARTSAGFQRIALGLWSLILCGGVLLPGFAQQYYRQPALRESLRTSLLWDPAALAPGASATASYRDPSWAALETGLKGTYARLFPFVFSHRVRTVTPRATALRPSVLLIVFESFRADSLTPERMPRLAAWAQRGLVATQHFGGSTFSEAGMFSLIFGRSPLLYHATLDAHEPPTWCAVAHSFGMTCSYYSGQPQVWMRLEEFLNPRVVDHFVHDDSGSWNDWDRKALQGAVDAIRAPGAVPGIYTVYLMSTHFEYQYPPAYERHVPVITTAKWPETNMTGIDISNRVPMTNRYLNSLAFSDDLVANAIEKLDPARTVIVVTGDHGESLGDDGRFGHAYSFADVIAKVPLAIVGPGIVPSKYDDPSLHADVLRTLVHALGGDMSGPAEARDLLATPAARSGLLLAHCSFDHDSADAVLISGDRRIRLELGLRRPEVKIKGPENSLGRPADTNSLSAAQVQSLLATFETSLMGMWQPGAAETPNH